MDNWTCPSCGTKIEDFPRFRNLLCPICNTYMKGSQAKRFWIADIIFMVLVAALFIAVRL